MDEILEIAKAIQENNKDEAIAIVGYTELLKAVFSSNLAAVDKQKCNDSIQEIISDELNHQQKLQELYTMLTGIEINKT